MTAMRVGLHRASMPRRVTSYPSSSAKHTCHGASPGKSASRPHRACLDRGYFREPGSALLKVVFCTRLRLTLFLCRPHVCGRGAPRARDSRQ
eukprot:scaffold93044_cov62-Phaeocystis_antarctica.AAC.9